MLRVHSSRCKGSAEYVLAHMPRTVQMTFSDIGDEIFHGGRLIRGVADGDCPAATDTNPCRIAFQLHPWGITSTRPAELRDPPPWLWQRSRGPEAINVTEVDIGYTNTANERGANFWTAPRGPRQEARQSQLAPPPSPPPSATREPSQARP